jgi:hypothetical protein
MTNIHLNILKFWTKQEMHHQIEHQFSKFEQCNSLQLINFQSNNIHLFLLKCNKAKRGGRGAHHVLWRWRPVEAMAADGGQDWGSGGPLAVRAMAASGLTVCLSLWWRIEGMRGLGD